MSVITGTSGCCFVIEIGVLVSTEYTIPGHGYSMQ